MLKCTKKGIIDEHKALFGALYNPTSSITRMKLIGQGISLEIRNSPIRLSGGHKCGRISIEEFLKNEKVA
jgi:hypothetical protein